VKNLLEKRDPFAPGPTEEELQAELVSGHQRLADANSRVGEVVSEQRSVAHEVQEVARALRAVQARKTRQEMAVASGSGPRAEWGRRW